VNLHCSSLPCFSAVKSSGLVGRYELLHSTNSELVNVSGFLCVGSLFRIQASSLPAVKKI
jgi:hypothetical protein